MKLLTFPLAGPLMGYGEMSRWDTRETADMPTKSAIIGLMGCFLGWKRGDERLQTLCNALHMAVRRERNGRVMTDFHTVQGSNGAEIRNAEGKPRTRTIITQKQYIQDAVFQVFLFGDEEALLMCEKAMRKPIWVACLGRRSCPPAIPILPAMIEYERVETALSQYCDERLHTKRDQYLNCEIERIGVPEVCGGRERVIARRDGVIRADLNLYAERAVRVMTVKAGEYACS